jgi:NAD-dependent SIR2 family protein deacetylase
LIDPLVLLAHALYSNKGVYAVLLGSGLSRAAGIPTGWEITLELVRRIAAAEGTAEQIADPAAWYSEAKGQKPDHAALLDVLAATPDERRSILHRFIAPTPDDIEAGIKVPTAAHRALAQLAARGYIRVILTTNFDRLTEIALRDAGVEPTVIASADDAAGAMPLTHAGCVVIKLHGDYLDTRIRNTPAELAAYDPRLDQYLDRVLDEFGLIIVGWSGEWDEALCAAIARCPTRRFTTWWTARGGRLQHRARDLAVARAAQVIAIKDADDFFGAVEQKVLALEELNQPHPLSAKLAVAELKRYLLDPQQRIRLHDLVFEEVTATVERARPSPAMHPGMSTNSGDASEHWKPPHRFFDRSGRPAQDGAARKMSTCGARPFVEQVSPFE